MNNILTKYLNKIKKTKEEYQKIKNILKLYPDLEENPNSFYKFRSEIVNKDVDCVEFQDSCSCCPDAVLCATPYKEIEGIKIFSKNFIKQGIGEKLNYHRGYKKWKTWEEKFNNKNINHAVIDKIKEFFQDNPLAEDEDFYTD